MGLNEDYVYPPSPPTEVEASNASTMPSIDDNTPIMQSIPTPSTIATSPHRPTASAIRRNRSPPRNDTGDIVCDHPECQGKDETFKRLCEWNKHMDRHERPYKCHEPGCEMSPGFTYSGGLLRHQREVHKMHQSTKPALYCPFHNCNRSEGSGQGFTRRENLEEHKRRRHLEELSDPSPPHPPRSASLPMTSPSKQTPIAIPTKKRKRPITPQTDAVDDDDAELEAGDSKISRHVDVNESALVKHLRMQIEEKDNVILRQAMEIQQLQQFIKSMPTQALYASGVLGEAFPGHRGSIGGNMM